jgi:ADP-ribose pyrophosphatase
VTDDGKLVLVEQTRAPVGRPVIELPAGLVGDSPGRADEALAVAARRELLEETGYEARDMTLLVEGAPSAGLTSETIVLFLATGLRKVGPGGGDSTEDIKVHEVPLARAREWLSAQADRGAVIDLKVYAGLYFAGAPK